MSSRLTLALLLVAGLSCDDMLLFRAGQDYYPLVPGSTWKYLSGTDTVVVSVDTAAATVQGRSCIVVYRNFAPEYWLRDIQEVRRFNVCISGRPNYEDTLEARFGLVCQLPLVTGATWLDVFRDTVVLRGTDTVRFEHRLSGRVTAIEDVGTPAGDFADCYRLELDELIAAPETSHVQTTEWLAPGIGVVKRLSGTAEELLLVYERVR